MHSGLGKDPQPTGDKDLHGDPVVLFLGYLLTHERLGRRRLARRMGLSEMTVRLALDRLRNQGLVELGAKGAALTSKGYEWFYPVTVNVKGVCALRLVSLIRAPVALGALVDASASRPPWWYRDLAVREGGGELLLLSFRSGELRFPQTSEPVGARNPEDTLRLRRAFPHLTEGELVVVVAGPDPGVVGRGLWRVIAALLFPESRP